MNASAKGGELGAVMSARKAPIAPAANDSQEKALQAAYHHAHRLLALTSAMNQAHLVGAEVGLSNISELASMSHEHTTGLLNCLNDLEGAQE